VVKRWGGRWRAVTGSAGRAVIGPPKHGRVRARELTGTCGHGPSWAAGKRALPI
jgi:hypothetical protein